MKKLILFTLAVALPMFVKAQGTVNFVTSTANQVITISGVGAGAGVATAALYAGGSAGSLAQIGATTVTIGNGAINGGTRTTGVDVPAGTTGFFQVRAWTGGFATYELALAAAASDNSIRVGQTTVFQSPTGNPAGSPPTNPSNLIGWVTPIALAPVPEPSTIALGILGAGSLLFLRRKK